MNKIEKCLIVFFACLMLVGPAKGNGFVGRWTDGGMKRYQFGFGVSTAILDNMKGVNQYMAQNWEVLGNDAVNIRNDGGGCFSLYLDYEYRISEAWSVEARLKYRHRRVNMVMMRAHENTIGTKGSIGFTFGDIAVPITCNYRWVTMMGTSVELFGGMGISSVGLFGEKEFDFYYNDVQNTHGKLGVAFDRFSYSPFGHGCYRLTPEGEGGVIGVAKVDSRAIHTCELEVGLMFQF